MSAISANEIYLIDALLHKAIKDLITIEAASTRTQNRATLFMDVLDDLRS